ncbi:MAG: outer membrane lipoprotein-sorting protein [Deltaproteobacteria bacterium]|nr:outer membrane lipoprotein-sorting protein [Deltaproteobacteria bacterium]
MIEIGLARCERDWAALAFITRVALFTSLALLNTGASAADAPERAFEPAPADVDARELARRAEDNMRSDRTFFRGTMTVVSPRLSRPRKVAFHSWEDRVARKSLIRIDSPAKDKGTGFLKLHPNLWMYVPRVERTVRIPPSMMLQSWMGSDFTNDDLVRDSSELDDYDHRLLGIDPGDGGESERRAYVVEYRPHEDTAVVWGKILSWLDIESGAPLRQEFYDDDGSRIRVMRFSDYRQIGERNVPHHWSMTPLDKPGHSTTIEVDEMQYDLEIDEDVFTTRNLKRRD